MIPKLRTFLLLLLVSVPALASEPNPERVRWVEENALAVRSIQPADEDFSDLMPLARLIGTARVVQLGEATHGDGSTFHAKARLIRFLHQVMGFDVLAWEAGIVDVQRVDAAIREGLPAQEAARRGLYRIWANFAEAMPTLEYVRSTQGTARPIDTVGFDCRVSQPDVRAEHYPKKVFAFFDRLDPALISKTEREDFTAMSVGLVPADSYNQPGLRSYNRELPKRLVETIDRRRAELLVHYGPREIDYLRQTLASMTNMDRALGSGDPKDMPAEGYTRDAAMAENLMWWLNGPLQDRKVIVWAHNYHVMTGFTVPDAEAFALSQGRTQGGPMGRFLRRDLKEDVYTIGFLSHGGKWSNMDDTVNAIRTPEPDSLEALLHAVGRPYLLLGMRRLPAGHWLRERWPANFLFHEPTSSIWPERFDAIFFIDSQQPTTPLTPLQK